MKSASVQKSKCQPFPSCKQSKPGVEYICHVNHLLENPVYNALLTGDRSLSLGTANVKYFDESVSPFAGFDEAYANGFADLFDLLPTDRLILYATPKHIPTPGGWQLLHKAEGVQMVLEKQVEPILHKVDLVPLGEQHVEEMMALTKLTRPGPFGPRTIDFGHYTGVFENDRLVAMAGHRLHVGNFTEVSAVCTHPDYLGKGYASALLQHQLAFILQQGQTPFLHSRADNQRAIEIYERFGFRISRPINFYFLKK